MDITEVRRSELYNTLSWMGLLSTEEYRIREVRKTIARIKTVITERKNAQSAE